jgi:N-acetylmuramoyl-L-alanine amidase
MSKAASALSGGKEIMRSILRKTISNQGRESKRRRKVCAVLLAMLAALWLSGCAGTPAVTVRNTARTFHTVVIDAGHGGHDAGTRSSRYMLEKDAALDIALRLDQKVRAAGFNTVLTRKGDYFVTLDDRVRISDRETDAIFVSIHLNEARPRPDIHGVETYYTSPQSTELAQRILAHVATVPGENGRGIHLAHFHVLRLNQNPAVLVECGYHSNRAESSRFANPAYRDAVATAISQALGEQRKQ